MRLQLLNRTRHRLHGGCHGIVTSAIATRRLRHHLLRRVRVSESSPACRDHLFGASPYLCLRVRDCFRIVCGLAGGGSSLQIPCRGDDFFLRRDKTLELRCRRTATHRLARGGNELFAEWFDFEEKDVAAGLAWTLAATDVDGPSVIGNHITRLHPQILDGEQIAADLRDVGPGDGSEWNGSFRASGDRIHQLEPCHPIVIVGSRFDRDFFAETRRMISALSSGMPSPSRALTASTGTSPRPSASRRRRTSATIESRSDSGTVSMWLSTTSITSWCVEYGAR